MYVSSCLDKYNFRMSYSPYSPRSFVLEGSIAPRAIPFTPTQVQGYPLLFPPPTAGCPAHMQGTSLPHIQALATSLASLCLGYSYWWCLLPRWAIGIAHEAMKTVLEGLDILSGLPDTPPNSSSQNPPFPTLSYLLWRCPGVDRNYMDLLLFLILCSWHHLLAFHHGRQGFGFFSAHTHLFTHIISSLPCSSYGYIIN